MSARLAQSSPSWARYSGAPCRISRRIPHQTSGETLVVRWSGERPVYAGRFNMEKRELLGEGRADLWADGLSAAREARRRSNVWCSVHQPQHRRVLPTKQAGGGAEARQALLDFPCVSHAVRERHNAFSVGESIFTFRALPRRLQVPGDDEVLGLQRMKHHDLRENKESSGRRIWRKRNASCIGAWLYRLQW